MSLQFRLFTWSGHDLPGLFDAGRMNGYGPLFSFDPSADGISYASVFHWNEFLSRRAGSSSPSFLSGARKQSSESWNRGTFLASLNGHPLRVTTATAIGQSLITRINKAAMIATLHDQPEFSELFMADLLNRNSRIEEDLIDQLFNSSEKRLARVLLLLANFGKEATVEPIIGKFSQETLAEMIGTTRSRVSFFMNKFRKLGYIEYNGKLEIRSSLLNVVLYDKPEIRKNDASDEPR